MSCFKSCLLQLPPKLTELCLPILYAVEKFLVFNWLNDNGKSKDSPARVVHQAHQKNHGCSATHGH